MKNFLVTLILTLSSFVWSQNNISVLKTGNWYKIAIDKNGVYKIDRTFLKKIGLNTENINPQNIKIYGNGGVMLPEKTNKFRHKNLKEISLFVEGEDDGEFNSNDYILFYGKGPHQWITDTTIPSHKQNIYSDKSYYFITYSNTKGKRIKKEKIDGSASLNLKTFDDYLFHEKENINLFAVGRLWFGENLSINNKLKLEFPFKNNLVDSKINIKVQAVTQSSKKSELIIKANTLTKSINFTNASTSLTSGLARLNSTGFEIPSSDLVNLELTYDNKGIPSAKCFLDYIEISGKKQLIADKKQFQFRNFSQKNATDIVRFSIQNKNSIFQVWDISNHTTPINIVNNSENDFFEFNTLGGKLGEFTLITKDDFYTPQFVNKISNQNLHSLTDIEYLIITNEDLAGQAQRLADYHAKKSNLTTKVVLLPQIYNEFSSGAPDIVGIRDFIKHVYDNSNTKKTKYVCLFGDSSYDFKNRINGNNNIVPTYHATKSFDLIYSIVTDDFYGMINDNSGILSSNAKIDLACGRIPVTTRLQAKQVVDKILSYYDANSFGDWKNSVTLLADDIDQEEDRSLQPGLEDVAKEISKFKPELNINKLYADAFKQEFSSGGERYPEVKKAINDAIEKGTLVFNYFGHGGEDGLASERLVDISQINNFSNITKLPLFITVTCEFSRFDNPLRETAGEKLFQNPNGGAVSMITTSRAIFISIGEKFNKTLSKHVLSYDNNSNSIAENLIKAKNETSSIQKFFIFYFGDPAMKLAIPKPNIQITKINNKDITKDTLKALSKIKLEGIITDQNNKIINNFNGTLSTIVYDKAINRKTLDNDGFGQIETFTSQESKIFKGKSSVKKGKFSFGVIVPKDIKIAYGKSKISLYAQNKSIEKAGANFDIIIGGIAKNPISDTKGPEIKAFLNDESFSDGGTTNESPNLVIKLNDQSGINTSITAIDHDIVAILDGNEASPIILNDYYETALDDFTHGTVKYKLKNLSVGNHTLKIKAWDTYNNVSETSLSFKVISDSSLFLNNVLNYPNPFVNYTEFWFTHNKPNEPLEVSIQIFTVSGKLIKSINRQVQTTGTLCRSIDWDGLDEYGNKVGKGVYVYKLTVKTSNNLINEKYEKLVLL